MLTGFVSSNASCAAVMLAVTLPVWAQAPSPELAVLWYRTTQGCPDAPDISTTTSLQYDFVTAVLVSDTAEQNGGKGRFALCGGDATSGRLRKMYDGIRPEQPVSCVPQDGRSSSTPEGRIRRRAPITHSPKINTAANGIELERLSAVRQPHPDSSPAVLVTLGDSPPPPG